MKAAYGKKYQDRQRRMKTSSSLMSVYLGISVMVLHDLYRFGTERQVRYVNALNDMMRDGLERYRERGDTERVEAVGNLYSASRRDLRDSGVEIAKIDKQYAPVEPKGWKKTRRSRGNPYAVYLESTDELLAFGTARECSDLMDLNNTAAFYELCSKVKRGKNKKYAIVVLDDVEEGEYCWFEIPEAAP